MFTPTDETLTDSKFTVAGILSSMANGHGLSPFSEPGPSFANAVSSVGTPILTPTTLANLEQTFIELTAVQSQASTQVTDLTTTSLNLGARQSGFVPPAIDPHALAYTDDSSNDQDYQDYQDWNPTAAKRPRTEVSVHSSAIIIAPDNTQPRRRTPGPRRNHRNEQLTPEEEERRRMRRERNKLAAAKCRQRRVDQTNELLNETEELEDTRASLETELESLQQVKEHLEFVLEAHRPLCNVKHIHKHQQPIKTEPETSSTLTSRPTSLSLATSTSLPTVHATGVAITTPSSVITTLGLDNLVDHTGLTPLTGGPSNCASEVQRNNSDSSSPSEHHSPSLMAL